MPGRDGPDVANGPAPDAHSATRHVNLRVFAVIDDPRVVEKILRHLGAWHDPPACRSLGGGRPPTPPPPGDPGSYSYEPCEDVDLMPDYENVLTD